MERVDAKDKFIAKGEFVNAECFTYEKKLPIYNKHDGHEIFAVQSGKSTSFIEGREFTYRKNDVGFIPEGVYHGTLVRHKICFISIHVRPNLLFNNPELIKAFLRLFTSDGRYYKISNRVDLAKAIANYLPFFLKNKGNHRALAQGLLKLMDYFDSLQVAGEELRLPMMEKLKSAIGLMYEHFHEPLDVARLAQACALSRATFYRHFHQAYKVNPKVMLNEIRLQKAMVLLLSTDRKITEIAFDTGFFNLSNFNRLFQRKTGKTPRDYRSRKSVR